VSALHLTDRARRWSLATAAIASLALAGAACGGAGDHRRAVDTGAATAGASLAALQAAAPVANELPTRQQLIVTLGAIARLGPVRDVFGPVARLYQLVPPGPRLHPPAFDITATGVGVDATGRSTGCGDPRVLTAGGSRIEDATPAVTAFRRCHQRLVELGSQADGRFLLQAATSPYVIILYPYVEAFFTSVRDLAGDAGFRAGLAPGRFASLLQPGCGIQFYAATAAAIAWCDDAEGGHDPEDDPTVAALGRALRGEHSQPATSAAIVG
jgi:hypothetical protein